MGNKTWKVKVEYTTAKQAEQDILDRHEDPEDYEISDFSEIEISVVKEDNQIGNKSYGWGSMDKIILFEEGDSDFDQGDIDWCEEVASTICDALNKKHL